jgi:UDP-N-acetylenolpyruvoylglucosamine reductase
MAEQQKLTPAQKEALDKELDRQTRKKEEKAPTTKTEMGKVFKKGGYVRAADGIAQRGKTKGRVI